jgi:hypothetical protein
LNLFKSALANFGNFYFRGILLFGKVLPSAGIWARAPFVRPNERQS